MTTATVLSRGALRLVLLDLGLACCAVEYASAALLGDALSLLGATEGPLPVANVLVVSGTLTDRIAPAVRRLYDGLAEPRRVISFGACANSGGPYWDSYSVTKGVDQLVPVHVSVPGCPPRPEALIYAVMQLQKKVRGEAFDNYGTQLPMVDAWTR